MKPSVSKQVRGWFVAICVLSFWSGDWPSTVLLWYHIYSQTLCLASAVSTLSQCITNNSIQNRRHHLQSYSTLNSIQHDFPPILTVVVFVRYEWDYIVYWWKWKTQYGFEIPTVRKQSIYQIADWVIRQQPQKVVNYAILYFEWNNQTSPSYIHLVGPPKHTKCLSFEQYIPGITEVVMMIWTCVKLNGIITHSDTGNSVFTWSFLKDRCITWCIACTLFILEKINWQMSVSNITYYTMCAICLDLHKNIHL